MARYRNIKIPGELYKAIEENIKNLNFASVQEYIIQHLKQSLKISDSPNLEPEEQERIKERLRSLGYL